MTQYRYSGRDSDGTLVTGVATAASEGDLAVQLLRRGITLEQSLLSFNLGQRVLIRLFKTTEVTRITRQIALLLENRVNVLESIELAIDGTRDRLVKQVLETTLAQIRQGRPVADSFGQFPDLFDSLYVSMLSAGEMAGTLEVSFLRLSEYREQQEAAMKKLRTAMAYPLLVLLVAFLVVVVLVVYIVPVFESMYANFGAQLPVLTARVVALSQAIREHSLVLTGLCGILVALLPFVVLSDRTRLLWHRALLRIPILNTLVVRLVTTRYCRTLGSLLISGVDILTSSEVAARSCGNRIKEERLLRIPDDLMVGHSLHESLLSRSSLPKPALRLIAAGEKTGQLGPSLIRAADYYEKETAAQIATLTSLIEPVIILMLGVVVAFLLVALYLPLFDLVGSIK